MNNIVKVARLHLVDRFSYTWLVWGVLAFTFVLNWALFAVDRPDPDPTAAIPARWCRSTSSWWSSACRPPSNSCRSPSPSA